MLAALEFLQHSESALFLLDGARTLLWRNSRATRHLRESTVVFEDAHGRLALRSQAHDERLSKLFPARIDRLPSLGVVANHEEASEASWVLVLWPRDFRVNAGGNIARFVLAQLHRGCEQRIPEVSTLQSAFGFTLKEAGVVQALATGRDLGTHASEMGSTIATVRWHLKNALEKAHCHNQRQLLLLVGALQVNLA